MPLEDKHAAQLASIARNARELSRIWAGQYHGEQYIKAVFRVMDAAGDLELTDGELEALCGNSEAGE